MENLLSKLKFKSNGNTINIPLDLKSNFETLGFVSQKGVLQGTQDYVVFVNNAAELLDFLDHQLKNVTYDSVLWIAYPKGTSKIKTDINRDSIRTTAELYNITTVTAISINDSWSGLRFRPIEKVGK